MRSTNNIALDTISAAVTAIASAGTQASVRGSRHNSVVPSSASLSARHGLSSTNAALLHSLRSSNNDLSKRDIGMSSAHCAEESSSRCELAKNCAQPSDQKTLKVQIKVGSDNLSTQKNAEIYTDLGLDILPSSSLNESPTDSEGFSHERLDAPEESPTSILQIMKSFPVHGNLLLYPHPDDLIYMIEKEKLKGDIKPRRVIKSSQENIDTLACEELVANTLKLPLLSNSYSDVANRDKVETLKRLPNQEIGLVEKPNGKAVSNVKQRPQVPKFGNWENESDVPYTLYFDKARKGKKGDKMINPNDPAENPNLFPNMASQAQPEAPPSRTRTKPDEPIGRGTARPVHERRVSREDGDFKQFTESPVHNDNMGRRADGESAHRRQGGRGTASGRPVRQSVGWEHSIERSPLHPHSQEKIMGKGNASPGWEGKNLYDSSRGAPGRSRMGQVNRGDETPDRGAAVPKFGEWDESNPSSADGYTDIFNKVREEKNSAAGKAPSVTNGSSYTNTRKQNTNDDVKVC
ncbi:hypothetical protein TEA_002788 [Camellia sinensis var. sinensis]|uniref:RIN4 pathogenic type III effector avirulence factor Avr cleavage site domain-containing protein n=1 Tax=Camellia sinensis var. sinensis TaxID=542762 RepID=A0A4S4DIV1_CAMSN|nr:hypothetical protein TEA_002788 [Camellia sinensis var. sinensis]